MVDTAMPQGSGLVALIRGFWRSKSPSQEPQPKPAVQTFRSTLRERIELGQLYKTHITFGMIEVRTGTGAQELASQLKEYLHHNNGRFPTDYVGVVSQKHVGIIIHNWPFYDEKNPDCPNVQHLLGTFFSHHYRVTERTVLHASVLPGDELKNSDDIYRLLQTKYCTLVYGPRQNTPALAGGAGND